MELFRRYDRSARGFNTLTGGESQQPAPRHNSLELVGGELKVNKDSPRPREERMGGEVFRAAALTRVEAWAFTAHRISGLAEDWALTRATKKFGSSAPY